MKKNVNFRKFFSSKKFKYGSAAVVLTAVFCAFVILINALFTVISNKNGGFYIDLTEEKIYDLSAKSLEVISELDQSVEIIFCTTEDRIDDSSALSYVKRLAEKYSSLTENVSVVFRDSVKDPGYFNQFKKTSADIISQTSVIINCPENKRYIVYSDRNFFKFAAETGAMFAYDGESKLTSAIVQTALNQTLKAAFIIGHGEEKRSTLETLLKEQGYDVSEVDLKKISAPELAQYNLLLICNPKYDYTGIADENEGRVNEIGMLNRYLSENFGNLMVFISPDTPNLKEFSGFLADDWGVGYSSGTIVAESSRMAVDSSGLYFIGTPSYNGAEGESIHSPVTQTGADITIFANATPLSITFETNGTKTVSPVYTTSKESVCYIDGEIKPMPSLPLMTISTNTKIKDSKEYTSRVLVCGSGVYLNALSDQSFSNADVLKNTFAKMGNENVVTGIKYKVLEDTALTTTLDEFKAHTIKLTLIVPLIIAIVGIVIYIKRKKA